MRCFRVSVVASVLLTHPPPNILKSSSHTQPPSQASELKLLLFGYTGIQRVFIFIIMHVNIYLLSGQRLQALLLARCEGSAEEKHTVEQPQDV